MQELTGHTATLAWVALKAVLLFLTAVIAFRIAERRTVAEMGAFDFVAAVACGAIVGRVPNSSSTSYYQGAVTLVAILLVHSILTRLRFNPSIGPLIDHPLRVLVNDGQIDAHQLRRSGLTNDDLQALLREHDIHALSEVRYVIFEQRGNVSVVRAR
jgi:uncharacterized membrane protein YcaP (DUF421 family)